MSAGNFAAGPVSVRSMPLSRRRLLAGLSCAAACGGGERAGRPSWWAELGGLADVAPELRAAFADPTGFEPLPPAGPGSWRTVRPEPAQSIAAFRASAPNVRAAPRSRLAILPRGRFPYEVVVGREFVGVVRMPPLGALAAVLAAFFATEVDVLPTAPLPETPWREIQGHRQYDAPAMLAALAPRLPADAYGMLALVNVDVFAEPAQQFGFGWSTLQDRLAVVSFARFDPSFFGGEAPADISAAVLGRGLRVAIHEVGHLFGIHHCQAFRCAMNGVAHLAELDALPLRLCPLCLRKLHLVTGLDPRRRDTALVGVFEALGLAEDAAWQRARRRRLWGA